MPQLAPAEALSLVNELATTFLATHYPGESEQFTVIWGEFQRWQQKAVRSKPKGGSAGTTAGGLPFACGHPGSIVSPYVVLTLDAVVRELNAAGHCPDLSQVESAVASAARTFGATTKLVAELTTNLVPKLADAFANLDVAAQSGAKPVATDGLYVDRMVKGVRRKNGWQSRDVQLPNRANPNYDILVDEIRRDVLIRQGQDESSRTHPVRIAIEDFEPRAAAMLWLVLKNFGGSINYAEAREQLGIESDAGQDNAVHWAKHALGKHLGPDLMNRIFEKPSAKRYQIRNDEANYCWMRLSKDPKASELLYRAGHPSE